ncbi:hypothetical protein STRAU_0069 [Streptomyces aurantiacus JA 4570]|uniref:Uncharacterized protein n=1 Tax=Streptomyces aurantiacus JA 4570 TaxID=1286094 RepID=S3ZUN1_9ACTN|nr:hypothetical protein STRAU_0069 [Streptomyces aurantiacus JA 4570]
MARSHGLFLRWAQHRPGRHECGHDVHPSTRPALRTEHGVGAATVAVRTCRALRRGGVGRSGFRGRLDTRYVTALCLPLLDRVTGRGHPVEQTVGRALRCDHLNIGVSARGRHERVSALPGRAVHERQAYGLITPCPTAVNCRHHDRRGLASVAVPLPGPDAVRPHLPRVPGPVHGPCQHHARGVVDRSELLGARRLARPHAERTLAPLRRARPVPGDFTGEFPYTRGKAVLGFLVSFLRHRAQRVRHAAVRRLNPHPVAVPGHVGAPGFARADQPARVLRGARRGSLRGLCWGRNRDFDGRSPDRRSLRSASHHGRDVLPHVGQHRPPGFVPLLARDDPTPVKRHQAVPVRRGAVDGVRNRAARRALPLPRRVQVSVRSEDRARVRKVVPCHGVAGGSGDLDGVRHGEVLRDGVCGFGVGGRATDQPNERNIPHIHHSWKGFRALLRESALVSGSREAAPAGASTRPRGPWTGWRPPETTVLPRDDQAEPRWAGLWGGLARTELSPLPPTYAEKEVSASRKGLPTATDQRKRQHAGRAGPHPRPHSRCNRGTACAANRADHRGSNCAAGPLREACPRAIRAARPREPNTAPLAAD